MNDFHTLTALARSGIETLKAIHGRDAYDLATSWDIPREHAKQLINLADTYLGTTNCTKKQRAAVEAAARTGHSLNRLLKIEHYAKKIASGINHTTAWDIRLTLVEQTGSIEEVSRAAAELVKQHLGNPIPKKSVRFTASSNGMRTAHITLDEHTMATWEKTLDSHRETVAPALPRTEGLAAGLKEFFSKKASLITPRYSTMIVVGLPDLAKIYQGDNPEEVTLGLSDGTTMTGADYLNAEAQGYFTDDIYAGLFHPEAGPVNAYRARHANFKQRLLATAENLVCSWPDCPVPADRCQVHHINAHKNGGHTAPHNLAMLCPYHNGVNDDDPAPPGTSAGPRGRTPRERATRGRATRGRITRRRGKVGYLSPGGHYHTNTHPVSALGAMHLI